MMVMKVIQLICFYDYSISVCFVNFILENSYWLV